MDIRPITTEVSVSDQLTPANLSLVHSLGYRSVICNRPDGEAADQPLFAAIRQAADLSSMQAFYVPIPSPGVGADQVAAMKQAYRDAPKPVLVYCRSGARSAAILTALEIEKPAG